MPKSLPQLVPADLPPGLAAAQLYQPCEAALLPFESLEEVEPLADHFGQERAVEALAFGLDIGHEGFNVFLLGSTGVGKRELLETLLTDESLAPRGELRDWCYVNNFEAPDRPLALCLPPGRGSELVRDMAEAVETLLEIMPATFQSDEYQAQVQALGEQYQDREKEAFQALAQRAGEHNVAMIQTPGGYTLAPMKDGEVITPQEFEDLPEAEKQATLAVIEELKEALKTLVRQLPAWKMESREQFKALNREYSLRAIDPVFARLKEKYHEFEAVLAYLDAVHRDVLEEAESFTEARSESAIPENIKLRVREYPQYSVNVLVDNRGLNGPPVIYEDSPSFANLLGRAEHVAQMGNLVTDFTLVKAGALHRANGGYLVLEADKVLTSPYAWLALKRALKAGEVRIQSLDQLFSFASTVQLQPQAISLDVKVVLTGDRYLYYLLQHYDPEFGSLFKVAADMSEDIARNPETTGLFARMIRSLQLQHRLLPLDRDGTARVIEQAARRIEDGQRLSLHRQHLTNLLAEADHHARKAGAAVIDSVMVDRAVAAADYRMGQFREKSHEDILRDILLVSTEGEATGQVNGLTVYLLGDYAFGKPTRITATARLGSGKVLDIEREVDLGGKIHSKAVMIISALLANRYAREGPLPLAATLAFEQSYGGIEGDSASVAEFVALASAIADIPVRQGLAVTGSLNQHGEVQAIGGINDKIEGFFDICAARGLSGSQGVVMPRANQVHLMLRQRVVDAVANRQFHIYCVDDIDQALQVLTGCSSESVNARLAARIALLQETARQQRGDGAGKGDE